MYVSALTSQGNKIWNRKTTAKGRLGETDKETSVKSMRFFHEK